MAVTIAIDQFLWQRRSGHRDHVLISWKKTFIVSWCGTRGFPVVSLALAVALPALPTDDPRLPMLYLDHIFDGYYYFIYSTGARLDSAAADQTARR